jgi:hypothetical protein
VVEFYHTVDYTIVEHSEPQDASLYDKRFRSEAHQDIDIDIDDEAFILGIFFRSIVPISCDNSPYVVVLTTAEADPS